ncbi:glycerate kinase [Coprothermobacteraceae bacterium]|nr:glycerate kinase [Coprothermobacteraceae bacterium]
MFKVAVAFNAFKGSLDACEATDLAVSVFSEVGFAVEPFYIADGGDSTVEAAQRIGGRVVEVDTFDPLMRPIKAPIAFIGDTAVIEMAKASGLVLLSPHERNPEKTTTFGTGILIREAARLGANRIILGIGGSATNDGGMGMLEALGLKFLDEGRLLPGTGGSLGRVSFITGDLTNLPPITVASDVTNPLLGKQGATRTYGPQKGADPSMLERLEIGMENYANIVERHVNRKVRDIPGAGAAGGVGFAALAFLDAELRPGAEIFLDLNTFDTRAKGCALLVTGEGKLDHQTLMGKAPFRVLKRFKAVNPTGVAIAVSGICADEADLHSAGFDALFTIQRGPISEAASMETAADLLQAQLREIASLCRKLLEHR